MMSEPDGHLQALTANAIRRRIMICYGLCAVAEAEVKAEQFERAAATLATIQSTLAEVNVLTADPNSLTGGPIRDLREMLEELDYRAWKVGTSLPSS